MIHNICASPDVRACRTQAAKLAGLAITLRALYYRVVTDAINEHVWLGDEGVLCFPAPDDPWSRLGWSAYFSDVMDAAGAQVLIRFGHHSAVPLETVPVGDKTPLIVHDVVVRVGAPGGTAAASAVRALPFARMEAAANLRLAQLPDVRPDDFPFTSAALAADQLMPHPMLGWIKRPEQKRRPRRPSLKIEVPSDRKKPDRFYQRVADLYLRASTQSGRPAEDIAEANGLPVSTVHRWVKEARRREILFPGQRGKGSQ